MAPPCVVLADAREAPVEGSIKYRGHKVKAAGAKNVVVEGDLLEPCRAHHVLIRRQGKAAGLSHKDIQTAVHMGYWGIGPGVYYYDKRTIVMEKFDMSAAELMALVEHRYKRGNRKDAYKIVKELCHSTGLLSDRIAYRRYFCADLRQENIVVNLSADRTRLAKVRLIDFDRDWTMRPSHRDLGVGPRELRKWLALWMRLILAMHMMELHKMVPNESLQTIYERWIDLEKSVGSREEMYKTFCRVGETLNVPRIMMGYFHMKPHVWPSDMRARPKPSLATFIFHTLGEPESLKSIMAP